MDKATKGNYMTTIEKIKEVVYKVYSDYQADLIPPSKQEFLVVLNNLLSIINTAEAPSEELEQAASAYSENVIAGGEDMFDAIADGFIAGANWQKVQMMKEAVDEKVYADRFRDQDCIEHYFDWDSGFKAGDKVKLIIIKEEKK